VPARWHNGTVVLDESARRAIEHVRSLSTGGALDPALPVTLHFHPDVPSGDGTVLSSIALDGHYRSQFVTGLSNGGLTARPDGDRWRWEQRMFAGAYDAAAPTARTVQSGGSEGRCPITPATPTSPRNWYALTKVLTEAAGQVYAATHGLSVVVIRPGWVPRDRAHAAELAASAHGKDGYLSPGDAGRGFAAAVEAEGLPRYTVVHVCSLPVDGLTRAGSASTYVPLSFESAR